MTSRVGLPKLTVRFENALVLAARLHSHQVRKGTAVPYVSHLMAVTALVLEDGAGEDVAIAAVLHDAVEDQGGRRTLAMIEQRFGSNVAELVEGLSEDRGELPWVTRKRRLLSRLSGAGPDVLRVKAADALHNVLCLVVDLDRGGQQVWDRFNPGACPVNQLWHYSELSRIVAALDGASMLPGRLSAAVQELRKRPRPLCRLDHEHPALTGP